MVFDSVTGPMGVTLADSGPCSVPPICEWTSMLSSAWPSAVPGMTLDALIILMDPLLLPIVLALCKRESYPPSLVRLLIYIIVDGSKPFVGDEPLPRVFCEGISTMMLSLMLKILSSISLAVALKQCSSGFCFSGGDRSYNEVGCENLTLCVSFFLLSLWTIFRTMSSTSLWSAPMSAI